MLNTENASVNNFWEENDNNYETFVLDKREINVLGHIEVNHNTTTR